MKFVKKTPVWVYISNGYIRSKKINKIIKRKIDFGKREKALGKP